MQSFAHAYSSRLVRETREHEGVYEGVYEGGEGEAYYSCWRISLLVS